MKISRVSTSRVTVLFDAVVVGQPAQDREGLLGAKVLAGVVEGVDQDLGLGLVRRHVVADLGGPDVTALVALADREDRDDVGVVRLRLHDLVDQLGPVVVAAHRGREVRLRGGQRRRARQPERRSRRRGAGRRGSGACRKGARWAADRGSRHSGYPWRHLGPLPRSRPLPACRPCPLAGPVRVLPGEADPARSTGCLRLSPADLRLSASSRLTAAPRTSPLAWVASRWTAHPPVRWVYRTGTTAADFIVPPAKRSPGWVVHREARRASRAAAARAALPGDQPHHERECSPACARGRSCVHPAAVGPGRESVLTLSRSSVTIGPCRTTPTASQTSPASRT